VLGWQPTTPLRDGLARTVAYFSSMLAGGGTQQALRATVTRLGPSIGVAK